MSAEKRARERLAVAGHEELQRGVGAPVLLDDATELGAHGVESLGSGTDREVSHGRSTGGETREPHLLQVEVAVELPRVVDLGDVVVVRVVPEHRGHRRTPAQPSSSASLHACIAL